MTKKIFIAGAGGIGEAAAILLREWSDFDVELFLGDISPTNLEKTKQAVLRNSQKNGAVETVLMEIEGANDAMTAAFEKCDVLLDCSPGSQARPTPHRKTAMPKETHTCNCQARVSRCTMMGEGLDIQVGGHRGRC